MLVTMKVRTTEFTEEAKKLISKPADFRRVYGDYFIAGGQRGSRFVAIYVCQASSMENMDKFKAKFKGEAPEVFEAEGSTEFMQSRPQRTISASHSISI